MIDQYFNYYRKHEYFSMIGKYSLYYLSTPYSL